MGHIIHRQPGFWENASDKIHTGAKTLATIKGVWDTGRALYTGIRAATPYMEGLAAAAAAIL